MFKLEEYFNKNLSSEELNRGITLYKEALMKNKFPSIADDTIYNSILNLKRKEYTIGPYHNLSIFEISNRLFSDLVVLDGAKAIFENHELVSEEKVETINLKLSNKAGFDLEIHTKSEIIYGEAFNVAPSFFQEKVRQVINKLEKESFIKKAILIFNSDAFDKHGKNESYINEKLRTKKITYLKCDVEKIKGDFFS